MGFVKRVAAAEMCERSIGRKLRGLVLLACLAPLAALADGTPAGDTPELRRELDGHNFIPSKFSLDPFVSTYVGSETGFGYGTAPGNTYDLNGKPIGLADYSVGAFAQFLNYQYGFLDWWAVRIGTQLVVYSGVNSSGAAAVGTNALGKVTLGTTVSFKIGDRLRLGGSLDVQFGPSIFFNVVQAVKDSIANGGISSPVNSTSSFTLVPAFVGAFAIHKSLGLTFSGAYSFTTASSGSTTGNANLLSVNALFDFDLAALNLVPIGFLAGFQTSFSADSTKFLQYRWQWGIFYTAVKPLNVGLEVIYLRQPVLGNTSVFLSSIQALIVLQYNFN